MDILDKSRFWLIGILILAVMNIGLLGFIWHDHIGRPGGPPPPEREFEGKETGDFMARELEFNNEQREILRNLNERQKAESDSIKNIIGQLGAQIVDELFAAVPDSARIKTLSEAIGAERAEMERRLFSHFMAIKKICNTDQQEKLQQLIAEVMKRSLCPPPPPGRIGDGFPPGPPGDPPPESSRRNPPQGDKQLPPGR